MSMTLFLYLFKNLPLYVFHKRWTHVITELLNQYWVFDTLFARKTSGLLNLQKNYCWLLVDLDYSSITSAPFLSISVTHRLSRKETSLLYNFIHFFHLQDYPCVLYYQPGSPSIFSIFDISSLLVSIYSFGLLRYQLHCNNFCPDAFQ